MLSDWLQRTYRKMAFLCISTRTVSADPNSSILNISVSFYVDGSCAEHLPVESYMVIYAANRYTYYY